MTQVQSILEALVELGTSTYDDLERATEIPRNKLRWTCNAMKNAGQIKQVEDSSRHELAWQITPKGRRHLESIPASQPAAETTEEPVAQPRNAKRQKNPGEGVETPVAGGVNISHSPESDSLVEAATTSTEVRAIVEPPTPEQAPAEAGSDVMTLKQWAAKKLLDSTEPGDDKLNAKISITGSLHLEFAGQELELPVFAVRELGQFLIDTEPAWS